VDVDFCVRIASMGAILNKLVSSRPGKAKKPPPEILAEAEIAERVLSDVEGVQGLGDQVPYNCPACGGVLWHVKKSRAHRYRCHMGHSFTASALEAIQLEKIEETLWISLRMFEERKNLLNMTAKRERERGYPKTAALQHQRVKEAEKHIKRLRDMLRFSTTAMSAGIPSKH
jgi:two-component system, chemotaxis family, protein-glutamate methylesterase/glutaminase